MGFERYILGPCSAETREQVLSAARAIKDVCGVAFIFRAGVWKPRTSPHSFQGAGAEGLEWLVEVKETLGVPVATEVATREHVEAALKARIDYLWIGARSSANPLAVQALADSISNLRFKISNLKGLLIKNPVNADAALWIGNIERLEKTGIPVIAVHRGCNHKPCWSMAHEVRLKRPDIPMLLDPSHMSGDAEKVPELLKKVDELGMNGAMIEVHDKPSEALSDAKQQISPEGLTALLKDPGMTAVGPLRCKTGDESPVGPAMSVRNDIELAWLRAEIDELDDRLWETVAARMDVSRRIGAWKKEHGMAALQPERYKVKSEELRVKSEELGLSEEFVKRIYDLIHDESLRQQS